MDPSEVSDESTDVAQHGTGAAVENGNTAGNAAPVAVLPEHSALRPVFRGAAGAGLHLCDSRIKLAEGQSEPVVHSRTVGLQYLVQLTLTSLPLVVIDLAVLTFAIVVARQIARFTGIGVGLDLSASFLPLIGGFILISAGLGLYPGTRLSPVEEFRRLAFAVTSIFAVWAVAVIVLGGGLTIQRVFLLIAYGICLVSLPVCRGSARRVLGRCSWWGFPTLVCGDDMAAVKLHEWLSTNRRLGFRPVGVIGEPEGLGVDGSESWYAGPWSAAHDVATQRGAYWAIVVPPEEATTNLTTSIATYLNTIPHIQVLSELTGLPDHWSQHQQIDGLTGIHLQQNLMLPLPRLMKRLLDIALASAGGLVLTPLLFYIAVAVKLSSRGPILYGHARIGKNGRHFRAWKFRSMLEHSDQVLEAYLEAHPELREEWEKDHKLRYDPRVTRIGRFIRLTSLDELPQLWNVFRGDMSLVGPRPIVDAEISKYGPYYGLYTMVQPGITGLWQVSGRNNTTYEARVQLDAYYVRNWSPWMDLYLLIRTMRTVVFAEGAY
jgi:Undecaprenyl-phosphate galactose phosphotransferase WbaP